MKTLLSLSLMLGMGWTLQAHAEAVSQSAAVQAIYELMAVANGACAAPQESDVRYYCLGAIPDQPKRPMLVGNGCFFNLQVNCTNGEWAKISGSEGSYSVLNTDGRLYDTVNGGTVIQSVEFGKTSKQ